MDYKEAIQEMHDELCFEFEEERGRAPTQAESMELYEEASDKYQNKMAALGDWMRKRAMGE
jgi:hypothetical protein